MHKPSLLAVALMLLWAAGCAAGPAKATVVCVGDSITLGEGVKRSDNFVSLLGASHLRWKMLNQGRSGWSTSSYLARREQVVAAIPPDAAMILVLLGTNDVREGSGSDTPTRVSRQLDTLTDLFVQRAPAAQIVLLTPPDVYPPNLTQRLRAAGFGERSSQQLAAVGDALRELASRKRYRLVDLFSAVTARHMSDGVHPNAAGHRQIRDALAGALSVGQTPGQTR